MGNAIFYLKIPARGSVIYVSSISYDNWGNITQRENGFVYIYNDSNQLIEVQKKYFYHTDHLGSTRAVTDENGNIVGTVDYKPFGDEKPYFPGRDTSFPNQSSLESSNDIAIEDYDDPKDDGNILMGIGDLFGNNDPVEKGLSSDRVEGNYSVFVTVRDVPNSSSTEISLNNDGLMDTDVARYYYLWVKPVNGASWMTIGFKDYDDPTHVTENLVKKDMR